MALFQSNCLSDRDCAENFVCFVNVSWTTNGCGCNTFYGYKYDPNTNKCSDIDTNGYFLIIADSILAIMSLLVLFCSCYDLCKLAFDLIFLCLFLTTMLIAQHQQLMQIARLYSIGRLKGVIATTYSFTALAMICLFIDLVLIALNSSIPVYSPVSYTSSTASDARKLAKHSKAEDIFFALSTLLMILAILNVPLYWIELSERTKTMNQQRIANITRMRKPLIAFELVCGSFLLITGVILGEYFIMVLASLLIFVVLIFIYLYSLRELSSIFSTALKENRDSAAERDAKEQQLIVDQFKQSTAIVFLGMIVVIFSAASFGLLGIFEGYLEGSRPGSISFISATIPLARLGFIFAAIGVVDYMHKRVESVSKSSAGPTKVASSKDERSNQAPPAATTTNQITITNAKSITNIDDV